MEIDRRQFGGGVRNWEWIKKGVPIRIELGPRDLEKNSVAVSRRDQPVKESSSCQRTNSFPARSEILGSIQQNLYQRALKISRCQYADNRQQGRVLRFLHAKESGETGNSWWLRSRPLERLARNRGEDKERPQSHHPLHSAHTSSEPGRCIFSRPGEYKRRVVSGPRLISRVWLTPGCALFYHCS